MKRFAVMLCLATLVLFQAAAALPQQPGEFTSLFDGTSLQGWTPVNTTSSTFTVKDGTIHVEGNSGWLRFDKQYTDLHLRVEFRFLTDNADSGVFVRAAGDSIFLRGWPGSSYQVQARDMTRNQTTNPIFIGNIYRHGQRGATDTSFDSAAAQQSAKKTGEWQLFEIEVRGDRLTARLNGTPVLSAGNLANPSGFIGLQGEAGIVQYRSIQIREIR